MEKKRQSAFWSFLRRLVGCFFLVRNSRSAPCRGAARRAAAQLNTPHPPLRAAPPRPPGAAQQRTIAARHIPGGGGGGGAGWGGTPRSPFLLFLLLGASAVRSRPTFLPLLLLLLFALSRRRSWGRPAPACVPRGAAPGRGRAPSAARGRRAAVAAEGGVEGGRGGVGVEAPARCRAIGERFLFIYLFDFFASSLLNARGGERSRIGASASRLSQASSLAIHSRIRERRRFPPPPPFLPPSPLGFSLSAPGGAGEGGGGAPAATATFRPGQTLRQSDPSPGPARLRPQLRSHIALRSAAQRSGSPCPAPPALQRSAPSLPLHFAFKLQLLKLNLLCRNSISSHVAVNCG